MTQKHSGFTIVELLIVIVVIGILAALTLNSFSGAQEKAKAASISQGLKDAKKAFRGFAASEGIATWWLDNTLTGSGNPQLKDIKAATDFKNFFNAVPSVSGMPSLQWIYDNDGDSYGGCDGGSSGVNVIIWNVNNQDVAANVDKMLDDGNLSCGDVRYTIGEIRYNISRGQQLQ